METQTPNVGLTKIRSFVAVAQTRQFRKAAEALGLSQPALSAHIRALEHELGAALFMRTTRSVTLTAEGERFLRCARSILKELDRAICELRDQAQLKTGRVVVAATPSVAANVLPKALAAFKARHPDVQLHVREEPAAGVERRVEAGDADFGIGPVPARSGDFRFSFICRDRFVGVVSTGHPLARYRRVTLQQLVSYPLITTIPESSIRNSLEAVLDARGIAFHTDHLLTQHQTVIAMVAAGIGVAFLPALALGQLDASRVVKLKVDPEVTRDIGVIERKGGAPSIAAREFLLMLRSQASDARS
jgi:LysR family carnitine catabolism transcriptional activator